MSYADQRAFRVLIVGGGVAGLEAALALRTLAGERVATMLVAPEPEFVYRPMRVLEPFAYPAARRWPLAELVSDIGAEFREDAVERVDPANRTVFTEGGKELSYDALLLAPGAMLRPHFEHVLTLDDRRLDEQLHGLIQDLEGGYVAKLAFVAPTRMPWPLPLYELALLTARRAWDMNVEVSITLITPVAAQQADTAAEAIAALAGAPVDPKPFHPVMRAILLGADKPLYLQAYITGGHGWSSDVSEKPLWSAHAKIVARYLTPCLESRDRAAVR